MNDFKENVKKDPVPIYMCKKIPGPNLTNSRNYAYSTCCDYCTKRCRVVERRKKPVKI